MSLLSTVCIVMLNAASLCLEVAPSLVPAYSVEPISDGDLAAVRGQGLSLVGIEQAGPAGEASEIAIASFGPLASQTLRELTDNWNFDVAAPLIAEATAAR